MTPEESPKPQEPSVKPIPKSKPIKRDPTVKGASPGSPSQPNSGPVAIAPSGIANAAPNFGNQTVNNAPPSRHLSEDRNAFISCIALKPGRFSIGAIESDQEAYNYAQEWRDVLVAARWEIEHKDIPIQIFTIGAECGRVHFDVRGIPTAIQNTIQIAEGSPENQFVSCLKTVRFGGTVAVVPYSDLPAGFVRISVSHHP
jgi:hypothetical protein